ncbi:META domain-containing protein [Psychroserpens sp. SPM9]|uniref:META domain-containing protein n=1 Tax=Psychroserpens sp. SPM9 TaxID=2975598 RepID=UPI0021A6F91E|nr:META domain-containing protein [Psychroserpens sp. SPM9]MDG5490521.1 META domain-containing protein [Psychroserpens sp. SPM9]
MKLLTLNVFAILILITSCDTAKKENTTSSEATTPKTETALEDTKWKLVTLMGKDVSDKDAYITLSSKDHKVYGNASCNNFNGTYQLNEGSRITLLKIAATRKACPDMSVETPFLEILEKADNYALNGTKLTLNKAKMAPYAVFEAVK